MKQRIVSLSAVLLLFCTAGIVRADEISELKEQLRVQGEILKVLQQKIEDIEARQKAEEQSLAKKIRDLEARQKVKEEALNTKMDEVVRQAAKLEASRPPTSADWTNRIKWSGDFRYRSEHIDAERAGSVRWHDGQTRNRIRARLMLEAIVNDEWDVAFRIASGGPGSDTPHEGAANSTNQDLENAFSSKSIWLDLAFFHWHPVATKGLDVYGGKIKNPFYRVGGNQLMWDTDLNPEGIGFQYEAPLTGADTLFVNGGAFWVDEVHSTSTLSADGADISLWGAQGYLKHTIGNPDYILAGAGWYDYANLKGTGALNATRGGGTSFFGNTTAPGGTTYASDYDIFEVFSEYGTRFAGFPVTVFGEWVQNVSASTTQDEGWLAGVKFNKLKEPGSWEFLYNYRQIEADAFVGLFNDSDFGGGGTDIRGHKLGLAYQLTENTVAALIYMQSQNDTGSSSRGLDYRRLMADLKLKFK